MCDIAWIGISLTDDIDGPFNLEIEYIGLEDASWHTEEHAYETYNFDNYFYKEWYKIFTIKKKIIQFKPLKESQDPG